MKITRRQAIAFAGTTAAAVIGADAPRATAAVEYTDLLTTRIDNMGFAPNLIDADHRSTTFSGDLIATDPTTGSDRPYSGQDITIQMWYPNGVYLTPPPIPTVTTDAQGHFTTVLQPGAACSLNVNFMGHHLEALQSGYTVQLSASVRPARLTVAPDRTTGLREGETITLSGRLEWQVAGVWLPYPGQVIQLDRTYGDPPSAVTDADGAYSITAAAQARTYTVAFNSAYVRDYLVSSAQATTAELSLVYPVSVHLGAWNADQDIWRVDGNVVYGGNRSRGTTTVHLQTALPGTRQWTTIASVNTSGYMFQTDIKVTSPRLLRAQIDADDTFLEGLSDRTCLVGTQGLPAHMLPRLFQQSRLR